MVMLLIIGLYFLLLWADKLAVESINSRVNPYGDEEPKKGLSEPVQRSIILVIACVCLGVYVHCALI